MAAYCVQAPGPDDYYATFKEANLKCVSDTSCIAIVDHGCDNKDEFTVCFGTIHVHSYYGRNSCIYKKAPRYGMLQFISKKHSV